MFAGIFGNVLNIFVTIATIFGVIGGIYGLVAYFLGPKGPQETRRLRYTIGAVGVLLALAIILALLNVNGGRTTIPPTPTAIITMTPTMTPSPTPAPTMTSSPTPTIPSATVNDLRIVNGIYTSGFNTAVIGQEFDAYYLVENTGNGDFTFQDFYLAVDTPGGITIYMGGDPFDTDGNHQADYRPLKSNETRKIFMQVSQFAAGCSICQSGSYRLYAVVVLPGGNIVPLTNNVLPATYEQYINVCTTTSNVTPNQC